MSSPTISAAAEAFDDWTKPWSFYEAASSHVALSDADREVLDAIWTEACKESHWHAGLQQGCDVAGRALATQFPWLSTGARSQVVRAASYQWR